MSPAAFIVQGHYFSTKAEQTEALMLRLISMEARQLENTKLYATFKEMWEENTGLEWFVLKGREQAK